MTEELIKKAKKGDKIAFEEIMDYYQNTLYKVARTRLNSIEDIEDAIQETVISAYKSIHKLYNISKIKSWLITILINQCNSIYKQKQKNNTISFDVIEEKNYICDLSKNNTSIEFDTLMKILSKDERTILLLYYSEGYKTKEIGKLLNINDSTIRTIISRAKKKIEKQLKEENIYG